ncbi:MAG: type B DNA-directed DNA polymerase [Methanomassiliicoccales archaeon]|jgi:DNA polymerase I|nr:type B DNA-directed DNA polymerase [Methanomassiliicoccales archaeon]
MWVFDSSYGRSVELWIKDGGTRKICEGYSPPFFVHFKDKHSALDLIEGLASRYKVEECRFKTIYGVLEGYAIHAPMTVAELIEKQTKYDAELFNVDVRRDHRFLAERNLSMCTSAKESKYSLDFDVPLEILTMRVEGDIQTSEIRSIKLQGDGKTVISGNEKRVLSDLSSLLQTIDPDVILLPNADIWIPRILEKSRLYRIQMPISRSGRYRTISPKSYWSYGKVNYRGGSVIPEGRILIDTENSFTYAESGLYGVITAARLTGLSPNLTSRFTPGTLISSYEVYEAVKRGIAVPFRKSDAEHLRHFRELKAMDKGGMIFQPEPGLYEKVYQLDFTSLYPFIIVRYNLSPESLNSSRRGFLPEVIEPLLQMRIATKREKRSNPKYAQLDSILKWMLVTCFGYTGYRNAKFGSIEVHERITSTAREILVRVKEIAESMGLEVLHGIVDCLWIRGEGVEGFKERVEREIVIPTEIEEYDWIVFLPMEDGSGAYNRYFGRLSNGEMKVRGVMARRDDTPVYIKKMQEEMFKRMSGAKDARALSEMSMELKAIYNNYLKSLPHADFDEIKIRRKISKLDYTKHSLEASAVEALLKNQVPVRPGMEIEYVVVDAKKWRVGISSERTPFDVEYYEKLLAKAWREIEFALVSEFDESPGITKTDIRDNHCENIRLSA